MGNALSHLTRLTSGSDKVVPVEDENENIVGGDTPIASRRNCTDLIWFLVLIVFTLILGALFVYCVRNGDIFRILNGYDQCGNVCGKVTEKLRGGSSKSARITCLGADMTKRKYLFVRGGASQSTVSRECVSECTTQGTGYRRLVNRCIPSKNNQQLVSFYSKTGLRDFFEEVAEDLELCWREILGLFFISLAFSVVLLLLLRYAVALIVWVMLGSVVTVCLIATVYLWSQWSNENVKLSEKYRNKRNQRQENAVETANVRSYLGYAVVSTVVTVIVLLLVLVMRKRVRLVVQLFKEAGKAINNMPTLLIQPWITFIMLLSLIALWLYTSLWVESSGLLTMTQQNSANIYQKNFIMQVTRWYHLFAMFWITQLVLAGQHMIVAGAVSSWYFTRKKSQMGNAVVNSTGRMLRYHLGTISLGGLILAIVQFLRVLLQALFAMVAGEEGPNEKGNKSKVAKACSCCLYAFEKFLAYLNRNAYIQVSMRSCNFWEGGNRAFKIIGNNAMRVVAINSVGDFVLFMGKIAVVISTMLVGIQLIQDKDGVQHMWVQITLTSLFAYLIAHSFMSIYEMAIDTIFVCFCEDCDLNDGVSKPYFMSKGLMEFAHQDDEDTRIREKTAEIHDAY